MSRAVPSTTSLRRLLCKLSFHREQAVLRSVLSFGRRGLEARPARGNLAALSPPNVRCGSNATKPLGVGADQCLLFLASDQIADKPRVPLWARYCCGGPLKLSANRDSPAMR